MSEKKLSISIADLIARAKAPGHYPKRDFAQFLRFYLQLRETHPLPWDWSDDVTELTQFVAGNDAAHTRLVFTKRAWNGTLIVRVELDFMNHVWVFVADETGEGLNEEELSELFETLLGVTTDWIEPEFDYGPVQETASDQDDNGEHVWWEFVFVLDPYPSTTGVSQVEVLEW